MEQVYIRRNCFAERLKAKRIDSGLGQVAFAKLLGIAQPTLAKYEMCKREPDLDGLLTICERLNTSPNELLGFNASAVSAPPREIVTGDNSPVAIGGSVTQTINNPPGKKKARQ